MTSPVRTTCPYCGVGCGVLATPGVRDAPHGLLIEGDPAHPANFGRLCVKGAALGETVGLDGRVLHPVIRDPERQVSWDEALQRVADGFSRVIRDYGPEAVAFYVSGQLLTEDYYVANKLMKGFIGTANIDTNSRLCMASAVAGHKRAFGADVVPVSYSDLEQADLVVLVGSNTAWCHPVVYQRIAQARQQRPDMKVVVVDPRATATCDIADLHLPLRGGSDAVLFNGLLVYLHQHGVVDCAFVDAHTTGLARTLAVADNTAGSVRAVAAACRVDEHRLEEFYRLFARTERVVTVFSQGINQSSSGTDKVNAIINCHLLTGRLGRPGMGPFSITGQPNAMGGREVGGLASTLAAHMDFDADACARVQRFWNSPRIAARPGLNAVDLFEQVHAGRVKALWIMATNPVVSLPDADRVRAALARCELVVVSDAMRHTDSGAYAHVLLPAATWGEKDGTVTNSERVISRCRAFREPPGQARPDWWMVCEVARRMGFGRAFNYAGPHEIFDEHARLSGFENGARDQGPGIREEAVALRAFNIAGLAGLSRQQYDALAPIRWPVIRSPSGEPKSTPLPLELLSPSPRSPVPSPVFYHPNGKARFVPVVPRAPANAPDGDYRLMLNTGRIRDQWHTMTRTGQAPRLATHRPEPFVDMHPHDALLAGVRAGELARVATRWGTLVARLRTSADQPRGSVFVPIHWNDQFASDARVGALVNPVVDPVSGEPEFKHTPARVEPFLVDWHGFALRRDPAPLAAAADPAPVYWTRVTGDCFTRFELAGRGRIADHAQWGRALLGATGMQADWLEYQDATAGIYRAAYVVDDRIQACVFVSPRPDLPSRAWLAGLFAKPRVEELDRVGLLVGEPIDRAADTGPTVCACYGVGRNTLRQAIVEHGLRTPEQVGRRLQAGTNCGSCVPELRQLIAACAHAE